MSSILSSRKKHIRDTAQNLFRKKGYTATSMREIAEEVGIKAASLYNHFKKKEEILASICFDMALQFFDALEEVKSKSTNSVEMLSGAIRAHVQVIISNLDASAVFLHEWRSLDDENLFEFKSQRKLYESNFHQIIKRGIQEKVFKDVDPHFYSLILFSSMNWLYDLYRPDGKFTPKEIEEQFVNLLMNGLKV